MAFFQEAGPIDIQYDKAEDLHRHPETGISVLVVGGGPAGLYTALECWRKGHTVVGVLERSPGPSAAGMLTLESEMKEDQPILRLRE